jgi:hypothetical protein
MSMPPSTYLAALGELLRLDFAGEHVWRALGQIGAWLAGPSESVILAPVNAAAIAVVARVAFRGQTDPWLRLIASATLVQQCVGIVYLTAGRYYYLTWLLTLLVVMVWLHDEGTAVLRRWFPFLGERIAKHPARLAMVRDLDRAGRLLG